MHCSFRLHLILLLAIAFAGPTLADTARQEAEAGFPWSVLLVIVIGMGIVMALLSMATRKPTNGDSQPSEVEPPAAAGSPATAAAAGLAPTEGTGVGSNIAGGLAGGLAAGAGIAAGEEIARHLLTSGEHEGNSPASEIAEEQHEDDHVAGRDFGVSGASSWDDKDQASGGDDWT